MHWARLKYVLVQCGADCSTHLWSFPLFLITICCIFCSNASAQNLIPDGGFEELRSTECGRPDVAFKKMKHWYLLDATPDLFESNCAFDEKEFIYWNEQTRPYEGDNYIGLWSRWNSNNNYFSEGIAVALDAPLKKGQVYELQIAVKNRGSFQGLEDMARCILQPDKHLDLYLSQDSITVINDFSTGTASTTAALVGSFDSEVMTGRESDDWELVSICFQAEAAYRYLALIMPLGTFGELPECATNMATSGLFRSFYYNIDDVALRPLALDTRKTVEVCADRAGEVDVAEIFDQPLLAEAVFTWPDGNTDPMRRIPIGTDSILITADISCAQLDLKLDIVSKDCGLNVYVPDVFKPIGNTQNAEFTALFPGDAALAQYRFRIYDRWGNQVFSSFDPQDAWDGYRDSELAQAGIYSWVLEYTNANSVDPQVEYMIGDVSLLH